MTVTTRLSQFSLLALGAALFATSSATFAASGARVEAGQFTAIRTSKPPVLDGKIDKGEWDNAMTTSAIIAAFDARLITAANEMAITFDDKNFYFLFNCVRAPGEWYLPKSVRSNDDYSFGDPSVEVWIAPPKRVPETFQSIINTYPAVLDQQMIPTRGYTAQGWKGNWVVGVTEDADRYIIEASIPIKDFGVEKIKDGDTWKFLLCRTAQGAKPRSQGSWSITSGFTEIPQYPPVRLAFDDVSVQLRGAHTLLSGDYAIPLTLVGPSNRDSQLKVEFRFHQKAEAGDASDVVDVRDVSLKAGERQTLNFAGKVPASWVAKVSDGKEQREMPVGNLSVNVTDKSGATLFRQTIPYAANGWTPSRPMKPETAAAPKELGVFARYGPQSNVVMLRADILLLPDRQKVAGAYVRLLDPDDGNKELYRQALPKFTESYSDTHFELKNIDVPTQDYSKQDEAYAEIKRIKEENKDRSKKLKAQKEKLENQAKRDGKPFDPAALAQDPSLAKLPVPPDPPRTPARKVVVEVAVTDAAGNVLKSEQQPLELLRSKFTWQNNQIGISDKVLAPWTPVTVAGDQMGVWNRKLQVNGLGLLKNIDNGGTSQIRQMRLVAIKDGKEVPIEASAPKVSKQTDAAVTFTGQGEGAGLKLSSSNTLEFDGYVLSELTIAPSDKTAAVDKLYLEVVLPESEATHFCASAGNWAAVHDETPAYWSSQQTSSGTMINDFVPYIWLTNSDRAFLWIADSDKGWITEDQKKVASQEIIRKDGTVTLRINFIEIPATLNAPTTVKYAYQTFPSRPMPAGWRSWACAGSTPPGAPGTQVDYFFPNFDASDWVINWPYYGSSFPYSYDRSKLYFDKFAEKPRSRPSVGSIAHSIGFYRDYEGRSFPEYAVDWGDVPGKLSNADVTQSRGPIDLRIFHYDQWIKRSGMRALYADENYLGLDANFLTGGAYHRADGRLQPGYTYLGLREFYKRLNYVFHDNGAPKPNIWLHISSGSAYSAWLGDIFMEGENVGPSDEEFDYIEVLPAARMRAIASPKVNGGAVLMMCQSLRHSTPFADKHIHQFVGWVQAHDVLPEQVTWHAPIAQAGRFYRDDVEFLGYWHAENPVKATTPDCVASIHRTPGRALVWIVNTSRQDRNVDITIDWNKLKLDRTRTIALNAETGEVIPLTPTGLSVAALKRDFVAVHLVERNKLKGSQSFLATFDASPNADEALGSEMLEGGTDLVASDRGKALDCSKGATLWSTLNLQESEGRLSFRANFSGKPGVVLRSSVAPPKKGDEAPKPGLVLEIARAKPKDPVQLILRLDEKDGAAIAVAAPAEGWHEVSLKWKDGKVSLSVNGQLAPETLAVNSMNIQSGTGAASLKAARFMFGAANRSGITAIDDLSAWRSAD